MMATAPVCNVVLKSFLRYGTTLVNIMLRKSMIVLHSLFDEYFFKVNMYGFFHYSKLSVCNVTKISF